MNIVNSKWTSKTIALSVGAFLAASVVAGCGNKGTTGGTTSGTSATPASFSSSDAVATVNGESITHGELYPLMAASSGEELLTSLITYRMLMQEMKKSNLTVADADVDAFIQTRIDQGGPQAAQISELKKAGGSKWEAVRLQARSQLALEKLMTKDVKVEEAALKTWFDKNQKRYAKPASVKVGLLLASTKVRGDTLLAQLKGKTKTFQQLVDEQKKSTDPIGQRSTTDAPEMAVDTLDQTMGPVLGAAAKKLSPGSFSSVLSVGQGAYAVISVLSKSGGGKPDFDKLKATVENDYKLEQVARAEAGKNGNKQPFEQVLGQIETAVTQQGMQQGNMNKPSYHDLLGFVTQSKMQEMQTKMRETAKVTIAYADLKAVEEKFKPAATPAGTTPGATTPGTTAPATAPTEPHDPSSPTHTPH